MTDDDLDADIARMIAVRHARQTLGYSWYETTRGNGRQPLTPEQRKQAQNERQRHRRDQKREAAAERSMVA